MTSFDCRTSHTIRCGLLLLLSWYRWWLLLWSLLLLWCLWWLWLYGQRWCCTCRWNFHGLCPGRRVLLVTIRIDPSWCAAHLAQKKGMKRDEKTPIKIGNFLFLPPTENVICSPTSRVDTKINWRLASIYDIKSYTYLMVLFPILVLTKRSAISC